MTAAVGSLSLSLHVLDTTRGQAGAGLSFTLSRIAEDGGRALLAAGKTDAAGRWLPEGALGLTAGVHELVFEAGAYQAGFAPAGAAEPGFYDLIAIRFRMREGGGHYHIPLILSPFGYSTYRGG